MKKLAALLLLLAPASFLTAQKKPLDHTVYDSWQNIGDRMISNDGKWVVYSVDVQEGDNELVVQSTDATYRKTVARGSDAQISEDSRYVIFKIKPLYKDTRDGRIKKKKPDDMPKDSLAIIELGKDSVWKYARVKSYKMPEKTAGWMAYQLEKALEPAAKPKPVTPDSKKITDSLQRIIDSLQNIIASTPKAKPTNKDAESFTDADGDDASPATTEAGTDLVLRNLAKGEQKVFRNVVEYSFNKQGNKLLMEVSRNPKDTLSKALVLMYDLRKGFADTLSRGGNEFKNFAMTEDGSQAAWIGERDAKPKDLTKTYRIWYYKEGMDSAALLVDKASVGMQLGMTVSENGNVSFSKSGKRLMFGTAPVQPAKDTSLIEIDLVKLDVWHYKDDYLQTVQLNRLNRDLQTNYLAVYDFTTGKMEQLGSLEIPTVFATSEGDGDQFVGVTDYGKRIESQWTGNTLKDVYLISPKDGTKKLVKQDLSGIISPSYVSPGGRYVAWYDFKAKNYFVYDGSTAKNVSAGINVPLYDEENDSPTDPFPYGIMKWGENDEALFIYDKYSIWKINPANGLNPELVINGRPTKVQYRYMQVDPEERFIGKQQNLVIETFNLTNKKSSLIELQPGKSGYQSQLISADEDVSIGQIRKAKNGDEYLFTKETYVQSPDLYIAQVGAGKGKGADHSKDGLKLSSINPQQQNYNWGTAELYKWKTFSGKASEGILYKPENFDPKKKYPIIFYFYEKLSDGLNNYMAPAPTPSRLNIPFFVSRGYLVFAPDISYTVGHPAKSAYDFIVSAATDLAKKPWVDGKNMGIQGQSWGGIQVAQLVTMTDMFKAAWAGAPVANMTSAYGGIRWESGVTRQFQYEKTQSRIGATLWQKPDLYIESSPLFHLPKVKTPLVIMSNDADGAVPWYQGIELFTGMRRLGKQVWMLNYNGEAHNLVQRKNRKDIQIREQQYFDWLLKGDKPAKWITDGVPAVKKGKEWGLEVE